MSDYTYIPPDPLGPIARGDSVQVMDRSMNVLSTVIVTHVGAMHVKTSDGRRWGKDRGDWIASIRGSYAEMYPFPSIRKTP